jgi:hypothetical protein
MSRAAGGTPLPGHSGDAKKSGRVPAVLLHRGGPARAHPEPCLPPHPRLLSPGTPVPQRRSPHARTFKAAPRPRRPVPFRAGRRLARTMLRGLRTACEFLGGSDPSRFPWHRVRSAVHVNRPVGFGAPTHWSAQSRSTLERRGGGPSKGGPGGRIGANTVARSSGLRRRIMCRRRARRARASIASAVVRPGPRSDRNAAQRARASFHCRRVRWLTRTPMTGRRLAEGIGWGIGQFYRALNTGTCRWGLAGRGSWVSRLATVHRRPRGPRKRRQMHFEGG